MKKNLITFLATGAYAGCSPVMPGTVGTLWGVLIGYFMSGLSIYPQAAVIIVISAGAVLVSSKAALIMGGKDPGAIVCDEIAGFLVSIFLIPFTAFNAILVFLLFRIFDILKPYPVGLIDRKTGGGLGIVLDDLAAGVYANISAHAILWTLG